MGWDRAVNRPAADLGNGRSYIREVGGKMTLSDVRVVLAGLLERQDRRGGVDRPDRQPEHGRRDRLDVHRRHLRRVRLPRFRSHVHAPTCSSSTNSTGCTSTATRSNSSVTSSSASRNGGNGFIVSPATQNTLLHGDVSEHNAEDGYFINGRPLATGASASGGSAAPGSGTVIEDSAALGNGQIGILVEGGTGTVIEGDQVCASVTAIAVRNGVTDAVLTGNDIRCDPRSGFSIGPSTPGTVISGNTVVGPRTGCSRLRIPERSSSTTTASPEPPCSG